MAALNYTPLDLKKLKENSKESNINFYLLVLVTIAAAIFSVLLFIYIQKKNEKLNQLSEPPIQAKESIEPTEFPTPTLKMNPDLNQMNKVTTSEAQIASGEAKISTPSPTLIPTTILKKATDEAKIASTSAN